MSDLVIPERALSVRQPYASALVRGWKDVENRSWGSRSLEGKSIAIHASAIREPFPLWMSSLLTKDQRRSLKVAPLGAIVGVVTIERIDAASNSPWYADGAYAWTVGRFVEFEPIPCKGALILWWLNPDLVRRIEERLRDVIP